MEVDWQLKLSVAWPRPFYIRTPTLMSPPPPPSFTNLENWVNQSLDFVVLLQWMNLCVTVMMTPPNAGLQMDKGNEKCQNILFCINILLQRYVDMTSFNRLKYPKHTYKFRIVSQTWKACCTSHLTLVCSTSEWISVWLWWPRPGWKMNCGWTRSFYEQKMIPHYLTTQ